METWDAIRARRNVRVYTEQPIAAPDLDRILEAGRRSPSSQNSQPWDFVVVTERERPQEPSGLSRREPVLPGDVEEFQDLVRLGVLIPERLQDKRIGDRPVREDQANAPRPLKAEAARLDQAPEIVERDIEDLAPVDALPQR